MRYSSARGDDSWERCDVSSLVASSIIEKFRGSRRDGHRNFQRQTNDAHGGFNVRNRRIKLTSLFGMCKVFSSVNTSIDTFALLFRYLMCLILLILCCTCTQLWMLYNSSCSVSIDIGLFVILRPSVHAFVQSTLISRIKRLTIRAVKST